MKTELRKPLSQVKVSLNGDQYFNLNKEAQLLKIDEKRKRTWEKKDGRRNTNANLVITLAGQQYIILENGALHGGR